MTNQRRDRDAELRRASRPVEWAAQAVLVFLLGACIWASCGLATLVMGGGG